MLPRAGAARRFLHGQLPGCPNELPAIGRLQAAFSPCPQTTFNIAAWHVALQGLLRLAGTLMGAAAGIAIYYLSYLCDGLSRNDNPRASPRCLATGNGIAHRRISATCQQLLLRMSHQAGTALHVDVTPANQLLSFHRSSSSPLCCSRWPAA